MLTDQKPEALRLSPRLSKLLAWIPPQTPCVYDVGCDHGKLAYALLQTGRAQMVVASDLRTQPLARARALLATWPDQMAYQLVRTSGLEGLSPQSGDWVIIAGMGGLEIRDILRNFGHCDQVAGFLLHPTRASYELRQALAQLNLSIIEETLCEEASRVYPLLKVSPMNPPKTASQTDSGLRLLSEAQAFWGPDLLRQAWANEPRLGKHRHRISPSGLDAVQAQLDQKPDQDQDHGLLKQQASDDLMYAYTLKQRKVLMQRAQAPGQQPWCDAVAAAWPYLKVRGEGGQYDACF